MKRVGIALIIILIMIVCAPASVCAFAQGSTAYILHEGVTLYAEEELITPLATLNANTVVEVLAEPTTEGTPVYKIKAGEREGYVKASYVYYSGEGGAYSIYTAKAYADKVGGHVEVYSAPYENAPVIETFLDGTSLAVSESEIEGYHIVVFDDGIGYVRSESITTSISYNQRVALAIGLICAVTVVLILIITYYRRNAGYFKNRK